MPTFKKTFPYDPDYAVAPGEVLAEVLEELGISQLELAERLGVTEKHVSQIVNGVAPISVDIALGLERVTGVPAGFWSRLDQIFRQRQRRLREREQFRQWLEWAKRFPLGELRRRNILKNRVDQPEVVGELLGFFGVTSPDAWQRGYCSGRFAFRRSKNIVGKEEAIACWTRLCELEAQRISCRDYDPKEFRKTLKEIRSLTARDPREALPKVPKLCAEAGVAVVFVREFRGAPISGVAWWPTPRKALIGLTLRGKRDDRIWFSFFHESGHILHGSKKDVYLDYEMEPTDSQDNDEDKADQFAREFLIPSKYEGELRALRSADQIRMFAEKLGISTGIVVGRLQWDGIISYSQFNFLKKRIDWDILEGNSGESPNDGVG